jgi:D-alanyl-lipoteichoic acid acyltransferase DltB (MBOAT superfamily)
VIADNCAEVVNATFASPGDYSASTLVLGAVLFAFQIYGDFSGYSDIAIGTARLFGFDLKQNFAFPYFSRDIAEFWRRWHMSLSTWFRDYLYIPLGGSWGPRYQRVRNTMLIFLVSGFWHGANWTFVVWGFLHALFFMPLLLTNKNRQNVATIESRLPNLKEGIGILRTFLLVDIAWVFFRAESVPAAITYFGGMMSPSILARPEILPLKLLLAIALMLGVEWINRNESHGLSLASRPVPAPYKWLGYLFLVYLILLFGGDSENFIYFQF